MGSATMEGLNLYIELTTFLAEKGYTFVCPSPESQARVLQRRLAQSETTDSETLEDFFGWNLVAQKDVLTRMLPSGLYDHICRSPLVRTDGPGTYRSQVRISNFYLPHYQGKDDERPPLYYFHSSFPITMETVFFGPDTYLFMDFLTSCTHYFTQKPRAMIDVCCGGGAGAIHSARTFPNAKALGLDINPKALELAKINAGLAKVDVDFIYSDLYSGVPSELQSLGIDLIVADPPYIASGAEGDASVPIYADGGEHHGLGLSMRIVTEGIEILADGGLLMIFTGISISISRPNFDPWLSWLKSLGNVRLLEYSIKHPDMWPEEIGRGAYADIGRIQVAGAVLQKIGSKSQ